MCLRVSSVVIGSAGFYRWVEEPRPQAELGYDLAPTFWVDGLMTEALAAIVGYGFGPMGLTRIEATVLTDNDRSVRTLERLGFVREAFCSGPPGPTSTASSATSIATCSSAEPGASLGARAGRGRQSAWRRNASQATRAAPTMIATVPAIAVASTSPSTGAPVARARAGPSSPDGSHRPIGGMAATIERPMRATNPMPAAAAVERVTVEARNVIAAQASRASQAARHRDPAGRRIGGANRTAV